MTDVMLTVKKCAEILGIRTRSVTTLIKSGEIRASDVSLTAGGRPRWRISPDDLQAFITRRSHQTRPPRRRRRKPKNVREYF